MCPSSVGEDAKWSHKAIIRDLRWQSTQHNYSGNHNSAGKLIRLRSPKVGPFTFQSVWRPHKQATSKSAGSTLTSKRNRLYKPTEASWKSMKPQNLSTWSVRKQSLRNKDNWCSAMLLNTNLKIGFQNPRGRKAGLFSFIDCLRSI